MGIDTCLLLLSDGPHPTERLTGPPAGGVTVVAVGDISGGEGLKPFARAPLLEQQAKLVLQSARLLAEAMRHHRHPIDMVGVGCTKLPGKIGYSFVLTNENKPVTIETEPAQIKSK